jgi:hypothetical protein
MVFLRNINIFNEYRDWHFQLTNDHKLEGFAVTVITLAIIRSVYSS